MKPRLTFLFVIFLTIFVESSLYAQKTIIDKETLKNCPGTKVLSASLDTQLNIITINYGNKEIFTKTISKGEGIVKLISDSLKASIKTNCTDPKIVANNKILLERLLGKVALKLALQPNLVTPQITNSLNPVLRFYRESIDKTEADYYCGEDKKKPKRMVLEKTLDKSLEPIFSKVILNDQGLIQNGTASSVDYSDGLNIAASYQKTTSPGSFLKFGFKTAVKDKFSTLYKGGKYQNEFTLNLGFTHILHNASRFFDAEDCENLKSLRKQYESKLLRKYNSYLNLDTAKMNAEIKALESKLSYNKQNGKDLDSLLQLKDFDKNIKLLKSWKDSIRYFQDTLTYKFKNGGSDLVVKDDIYKFEIDTVKWTGYRVHWINYDFSLPFKGYYLYDKKRPDSTRYKLMGGLTFTPSYNIVHNSKRLLFYFSAGIQMNLDRAISTVSSQDSLTRKFDGDNRSFINITNKSAYNLFVIGVSPAITTEAFFGKNKVIGAEFSFAFQKYLYSIDAGYSSTYNSRLGILFSLNGEDNISKGVIGLFAQLKDYQSSQGSFNKNIIIGIRAGIPFSTF
ncbi:MAG: hypothetical protein JWP78_3156 [Mucilaginibacter sp.]|nr:hypothetical protein [Mucilaginibacter sp.]